MYNIANILTYIRLFCIPLMVMFFYIPIPLAHVTAAGIFAIAAITDWLDGFVARKMHITTKFGAFLDPVADKIMVAVALILVVSEHSGAWLSIPAAIIIAREILISALREWMAELGKRASIAVSTVAKIKTALQMVSLLLLLLYYPSAKHGSVTLYLGTTCLYGASILTLWSMIMYLKLAWNDLTMAAKQP
jgi:CDP-diacylglycerol---glycerol-3-phosphate 3-phosphatidyltransferase